MVSLYKNTVKWLYYSNKFLSYFYRLQYLNNSLSFVSVLFIQLFAQNAGLCHVITKSSFLSVLFLANFVSEI